MLLWFVWIVAFSLAPFEFSFSRNWTVHERAREVAGELSHAASFLDLWQVLHAAAFFVFGVLLVTAHGRLFGQRPLLALTVTTCVACTILESAKFFEPARHPNIGDLAINIVALTLGGLASTRTRLGSYWRFMLSRMTGRTQVYLLCGFATIASILWWHAGLQPALGSLRMDWRDGFRLMVANESSTNRPWSGAIKYAGIYGRALTDTEVARLQEERTQTRSIGAEKFDLLLGYDFRTANGSGVVPEGRLHDPKFDLDVPQSVTLSADEGLSVKNSMPLITRESVPTLAKAIISANAFSIEAWFRPSNLVQRGPARIFSMSDGVRDRNFTIGQAGTDFVFRVRNGANGLNGGNYELKARNAIDAKWQHFVAVYDHGVSLAYKNGHSWGGAVDLREPAYYTGLGTGATGTMVCAALLGIVVALPIFSLVSRARSVVTAHCMALMFTVIFGVGPYAVSCLSAGGPWRANFFLWFGGALVIVYWIAVNYATGVFIQVSETRSSSGPADRRMNREIPAIVVTASSNACNRRKSGL